MTVQVPLGKWPKGLCEEAMLLSLTPTDLQRRADISFENSADDLDAFQGAIVDLGDGRSIAFQYYLHSPKPGTIVLRQEGDDTAIFWVIREFSIKRGEVAWHAPDVPLPARGSKVRPSEELAEIVGSTPLLRREIASKVWDHIRKNNLQNPNNKREILADDKLRKVFGTDKLTMFEMQRHLSKHLQSDRATLAPRTSSRGRNTNEGKKRA